MAKSSAHSSTRDVSATTSHSRADEMIGVLVLSFSLGLLLSLISYDPGDPAWNVESPRDQVANWIGPVGAYVADLLLQSLGLVAIVLPLILMSLAWMKLRHRPIRAALPQCLGWLALCLTLAALLGLGFSETLIWGNVRPGGFIGLLIAAGLASILNTVGAALVLLTALVLTLLVVVNFSFVREIENLKRRLQSWAPGLRLMEWRARRARSAEMAEDAHRAMEAAESAPTPLIQGAAEKAAPAASRPESEPVLAASAAPAPTSRPPERAAGTAAERSEQERGRAASAAAGEKSTRREVAEMLSTAVVKEVTPDERAGAGRKEGARRAKVAFTLPPIHLLNAPPPVQDIPEKRKEALMKRAQQLAERCAEFAVTGHVHQISPGPVVTTFEFKPDPGIKYSRITSLADDLCLALEAESIRIDRIPGKSTVGIEVPNREPELIYLREIIESRKFQNARSKLTIALGKTIDGSIYVTDLAKMPHLLIAGATGSGKSMTINVIIVSLLYRVTPEEVRFILVDPKRLELGLYDGLPHLLTPIVMEPKRAAYALKWAVSEMEDRYRLLASAGVRNIEQYNRLVRQGGQQMFMDEIEVGELKPLPYLVIIIDELADLMMVASGDVETSITRLAQMARAVGIHLILATQRPSVDVITGLIKANFPCRIAMRVSSKVDSRTIIDTNGAERLLGRGDMLFLPPGTARLVRVHGAYVEEKEINAVVNYLKAQAEPEYDETVLMSDKEREIQAQQEGEGPRDELYEEAVKIVVQMGRASTSVLQRRLRIGYGRAASIIDMMERDGLVEPPNGTRPRAITPQAREFYERLMQMEEEKGR